MEDIDEEKRTLKIAKNMVRVDGKILVQRATQTASGKRMIDRYVHLFEGDLDVTLRQAVGA
jgi:uncharacterized protein YceH (UPF0502 family)